MSNAFNPSIVIYLIDLFAKIHHYFSTVIGAIVWVHTDSKVVLKDIDKKKSSSIKQAETQQSANQ